MTSHALIQRPTSSCLAANFTHRSCCHVVIASRQHRTHLDVQMKKGFDPKPARQDTQESTNATLPGSGPSQPPGPSQLPSLGSNSPGVSRGEAAVTPQEVTDRIFLRMVTCSGIPLLVATFLYPIFWFIKVKLHVDLPMWAVQATEGVAFGLGLFGLSYGALSASWDPRREGTALGWTEFQANIAVLLNKRDK